MFLKRTDNLFSLLVQGVRVHKIDSVYISYTKHDINVYKIPSITNVVAGSKNMKIILIILLHICRRLILFFFLRMSIFLLWLLLNLYTIWYSCNYFLKIQYNHLLRYANHHIRRLARNNQLLLYCATLICLTGNNARGIITPTSPELTQDLMKYPKKPSVDWFSCLSFC